MRGRVPHLHEAFKPLNILPTFPLVKCAAVAAQSMLKFPYPTAITMLLYDRFELEGEHRTPIHAAREKALNRNIVLWQMSVSPDNLSAKLAEASRIYARWELRNHTTASGIELFSSPGRLWLVAESQAAAAGLLDEFRIADLFVTTPAPPPPTPALVESPRNARPAMHRPVRTSIPPASVKLRSVPLPCNPQKSKRHPVRTFLLVALLLIGLPLAWFAFSGHAPAPQLKSAPIVDFKANRTRVRRGGTVILTWQTSGLRSLSIQPGVGPVPARGTRNVMVNQDTTFLLESADAGAPAPASVRVTVGATAKASAAVPFVSPPAAAPGP